MPTNIYEIEDFEFMVEFWLVPFVDWYFFELLFVVRKLIFGLEFRNA